MTRVRPFAAAYAEGSDRVASLKRTRFAIYRTRRAKYDRTRMGAQPTLGDTEIILNRTTTVCNLEDLAAAVGQNLRRMAGK